MCARVLPEVQLRELATAVDAFCDPVAFTVEECRRVLATEGLEPSPETVLLYRELLERVAEPPSLDPQRPPEHLDLVGPLTGRESESRIAALSGSRPQSPS